MLFEKSLWQAKTANPYKLDRVFHRRDKFQSEAETALTQLSVI